VSLKPYLNFVDNTLKHIFGVVDAQGQEIYSVKAKMVYDSNNKATEGIGKELPPAKNYILPTEAILIDYAGNPIELLRSPFE
jgi:hypothetical protein